MTKYPRVILKQMRDRKRFACPPQISHEYLSPQIPCIDERRAALRRLRARQLAAGGADINAAFDTDGARHAALLEDGLEGQDAFAVRPA